MAETQDDDVTAGVRHIEQINIDYAQTAKRINVKKIKGEIWSALKTSIDAVDMAVVKEKHYPELHKRADTMQFSELLQTVDSKVSAEASRDLSVSILMTCLLHLSNEAVGFRFR